MIRMIRNAHTITCGPATAIRRPISRMVEACTHYLPYSFSVLNTFLVLYELYQFSIFDFCLHYLLLIVLLSQPFFQHFNTEATRRLSSHSNVSKDEIKFIFMCNCCVSVANKCHKMSNTRKFTTQRMDNFDMPTRTTHEQLHAQHNTHIPSPEIRMHLMWGNCLLCRHRPYRSRDASHHTVDNKKIAIH